MRVWKINLRVCFSSKVSRM